MRDAMSRRLVGEASYDYRPKLHRWPFSFPHLVPRAIPLRAPLPIYRMSNKKSTRYSTGRSSTRWAYARLVGIHWGSPMVSTGSLAAVLSFCITASNDPRLFWFQLL